MLIRLSIKNIRKSIKDYAIYFFTLILGVCIFYVFNAIEGQSSMLEVSRTKSDSIDQMVWAISSMSIVVSLILGFLIVYANRFLMKKRNREFGIYLILGMKKGDILGRSSLADCRTSFRNRTEPVYVTAGGTYV